ncbi:MAG: hypothetical protein V1915_01330 [Candidatus Bathyarchaeota archaeon]
MTEKVQLYKKTRKVFEEAVVPVLGPSGYETVYSHLRQRVGRDPFEVLLEEPKIFYEELEKIFSTSTDVLLNHVGKYLVNKYGVDCSPDEFLELFHKGDASSKDRMIKIMMKAHENWKK